MAYSSKESRWLFGRFGILIRHTHYIRMAPSRCGSGTLGGKQRTVLFTKTLVPLRYLLYGKRFYFSFSTPDFKFAFRLEAFDFRFFLSTFRFFLSSLNFNLPFSTLSFDLSTFPVYFQAAARK